MIKKWSYVGAMLLAASCGLVFTGCIDNDEPYGIEQIRVATANLLEAKKAAVNAAQAAEEAKIEIAKINAEVEKIKAENERIVKEAEAKRVEAEAKATELRAQAEAAKTQAEAAMYEAEAAKWQAEADRVKAETEAYVAEQKARLDELIAQAELRVKQSQLDYDKALYAFQQEQIQNAEYANDRLYNAWSMAFEAYLGQLAEVNRLNREYLEVQKQYAEASIDLTVNGDSPKYDRKKIYENAVKDLEAEIAEQNGYIDFYTQFINDLKNFQSTDEFYQLFEKYTAEKEALIKKLAEANVEKASLAIENKDLYDKEASLQQEYNDYRTGHVVDIPAYTWEPDAALAAVGLTNPVEVVANGASFTLADPNDYNNAWADYNNLIDELKKYLLDENDIAWTEVRVNELTRQLGYANNHYATAKNNWENAKKAYNMGNVPDFSVIPMEADVNAALADFAATGDEAVSLRQAYLNAKENEQAKYKAMVAEQEALDGNPASQANKYDAIIQTYNDATQAAWEAYDSANTAAQTAYDKAVGDANRAENSAWNAANLAYYDWLDAINNGASAADQKKAEDAYNKKYEEAEAQTTKSNKARQDAADARMKAYNAANNAYTKARINAQENYEKSMLAWEQAGGNDLSKDPAAAKYLAAQKEYETAMEARQEANDDFVNYDTNTVWVSFWDLYTAFGQQSQAVGGWDTRNIWTLNEELNDFMDVYSDEYAQLPAFPSTFAPSHLQKNAVFTNVKQYLINMSRIAYGLLGVKRDEGGYDNQESPWDIDEAFVVNEVTVDMVNAYIAEMSPSLEQFDYVDYYESMFGEFGKTLALQNRIDVAKAMIANQDLLADAINPIQEQLDALVNLMKEAQDGEVELSDQWLAAQAEIADLEANVNATIANLEKWINIYNGALSEISYNIGMLEFGEDLGSDIAAFIEYTIDRYQGEIALCQRRIESLTESLERAKYQLDLYLNNEETLNANPYAIQLEAAEAELAAAKERLEFLKNRADELQAKYEAANK